MGLPDAALPTLKVDAFMPGGWRMGSSHIGNRAEMEGMLRLCAEKGIKPWVEEMTVGEGGCKEVVERVYKGDVRYRFTLTGFDEVFGKRV